MLWALQQLLAAPLLVALLVGQICRSEGAVLSLKNLTAPAVFGFGDSLFDTGNNNFIITTVKSDFLPYGRDFMGGKPTGRFSNGKIPPDLAAEELGVKDLLPPFLDPNLKHDDLLTGVNFASSGAGFDPLTSILLSVMSMSEQLNLFGEYRRKLKDIVGAEKEAAIISNALYVLSAGSDDIVNTYFHTPTRILEYTISNYTDLLTASATSFFTGLYDLGARNINVFGLGPIGCLPVMRTLAGGILKRRCVKEYNDAARSFNTKLERQLELLNRILPRARFVYVDVYGLVFDMIRHPHKYGFEVSHKGCCGTGLFETTFMCNRWSLFTCSNVSKFLFWDSYHPTEKAYRIIVHHSIGKISSNINLNHGRLP